MAPMNSLVHKYRLLVILPLGVYVYLLVQTAWCSDDAYIKIGRAHV